MNPNRIISGIFLFLFGSVVFLVDQIINNSDDLAQQLSIFAVIVVKTIDLDLQSFEVEALRDSISEIADKVFFHFALNVHVLFCFLEVTVP